MGSNKLQDVGIVQLQRKQRGKTSVRVKLIHVYLSKNNLKHLTSTELQLLQSM